MAVTWKIFVSFLIFMWQIQEEEAQLGLCATQIGYALLRQIRVGIRRPTSTSLPRRGVE